MSDYLKIAGAIFALLIFAFFILPQLIDLNNSGTVQDSVENTVKVVEDVVPIITDSIMDTSEQLCSKQYLISEVEDKIKSIPYEVVSSYNTNSEKDENVQKLLKNYQMGLDLIEMELLTIADDIDKHHKIKYGFKDLQKLYEIQQFLK